jgi:4-oxalmesaconate hydratase
MEYRQRQQDRLLTDPDHIGEKGQLSISDEEIRESVEQNQLRLQRERGIDLALFSPRASGMGHHIGNASTSQVWTEHTNDLIRRVCDLFPANFAPVCALPQTPADPEAGVANSVVELRRCVEELGFVGCNLNPDPSGGWWTGRPMDDEQWYPLYETMCELDVPAMIHVSGVCNDNLHATGSHYLAADTVAFMQAMSSRIFDRFPTMRWVVPHGGGAVPYHWGRFKGMAEDSAARAARGQSHVSGISSGSEAETYATVGELMNNIYFDTCVYHQPGIDLLVEVVPTENVLFASEMVGAVRGIDPDSGQPYDHTKRYVDNASLTESQRAMIFEGNVRRVYPRLNPILDAIGAGDDAAGGPVDNAADND